MSEDNKSSDISESKKRSLANLKPFKKGESGNLKGKPVGTVHFKTMLERALELETHYEDATGSYNGKITNKAAIVSSLINIAKNAEKDEHKLKATDMIMDRVEGKPTQYIENKEMPITNEDALERIKEIAQQEGVSVEEFCDVHGISL